MCRESETDTLLNFFVVSIYNTFGIYSTSSDLITHWSWCTVVFLRGKIKSLFMLRLTTTTIILGFICLGLIRITGRTGHPAPPCFDKILQDYRWIWMHIRLLLSTLYLSPLSHFGGERSQSKVLHDFGYNGTPPPISVCVIVLSSHL